MKKDISYIIKRVIIGVAIALIIMFLKSNVFAATCSGTTSRGYKVGSSWTENVSSDFSTSSVPNDVYIRVTDNNIKNSVVTYTDSFTYKVYGVTKDMVNPTIKVEYGTSTNHTDVSNNCTTNINKYYEVGEYPNNSTEVGVAISCSFTGNNSSANIIQTRIQNLATGSQSFSGVFNMHSARTCLTLLPNDYDRIINSLGLNRIELQNFIQNSNNEALRELLDKISSESISLQDVINQANETLIDSQQVCETIDKNSIVITNGYLNANGNIYETTTTGITDYIKIDKSTIKVLSKHESSLAHTCFYNSEKTLISCIPNNTMLENNYLSIPNNSYYIRVTINKSLSKPQLEICTLSSQALADTINKMYKYTSDIDGIRTNSNNNLCVGEHCIDISQFGPLPKLLTMPRLFLSDVRGVLNETNDNLKILKQDLPFYSKGIYRHVSFTDGYFVLPPLRTLIFNGNLDLLDWYDWLGTWLGALLLFVYLINKGRVIMRMGRLANTDNESWGGIS